MPIDCHSHTARCGHAGGPTRAYVERARRLGLREFAVTDHSHWMVQHPGEWLAMHRDELPGYIAEVRALQQEFDRDGPAPFRVRLGLEADFFPSRLGEAEQVIAREPWDVILGSIHHIGLWGVPNRSEIEHFDRYAIDDICECYLDLVGRMVRRRFCDVVTHIDLPRKFGHRPAGGMLRFVEPLIPDLRANDIAVEINTSGFDHDCDEQYPSWEIIEALHAGGVALTLCSDAHAPEHVGRHFDRVLDGLRERGIRELVGFERRAPHVVVVGNLAEQPFDRAADPHRT